MRYAYTIYYVTDVTATIIFYERAFGFNRKFIKPEGDYGELDTGATALAFASTELGKSNFKKGYTPLTAQGSPVGVEIAFVSDDIDQDVQRAVDAGATLYEPVVTKPWGQQVGYLRDPNGILIEICTPVKGG